MKLTRVMDEISAHMARIASLAGRTTAGPVAALAPPYGLVDLPSAVAFDQSYRRGADRITLNAVVLVGIPTLPQTRDALSGYLDGAGEESVKAAVDGDDYDACDSVAVLSATLEVWTVQGIDLLAVVFSLDVIGPGKE